MLLTATGGCTVEGRVRVTPRHQPPFSVDDHALWARRAPAGRRGADRFALSAFTRTHERLRHRPLEVDAHLARAMGARSACSGRPRAGEGRAVDAGADRPPGMPVAARLGPLT